MALAASPEVVRIQENRASPPTLDNSIPWINADDVLNLGFDGAGQTVAILDTGIDDDHPFYGGRIVSQACYSDQGGDGDATTLTLCADGTNNSTAAGSADVDGVANCLNGTNNICDHGSHVAGIAAGSSGGGTPAGGVARGANIIAVQVFTRFNQASDCAPNAAPCVLTWDSDQILGLQRVLALDATFTIAAANMSLGGGMNAAACDGDARKTPIDNLLAAGIATVISSGNNNFMNAVGAPGCVSTAVTVGATDNADNLYNNSPTSGTNRGPLLDLMAPGVGIQSSEPDDVFGNKTGTSMAAPHVTGRIRSAPRCVPDGHDRDAARVPADDGSADHVSDRRRNEPDDAADRPARGPAGGEQPADDRGEQRDRDGRRGIHCHEHGHVQRSGRRSRDALGVARAP